MNHQSDVPWAEYRQRFQRETWRTPLFFDMVARDLAARTQPTTMADIGCGDGFDGEAKMQAELASRVQSYVGIEPDEMVSAPPCCDIVHRCLFEDAPLADGSIDVAVAMFVLEHLPDPQRFFDKLYAALSEGGVFWGFTVDARSYYAMASRVLESLRLKDGLLDRMFGGGDDRYKNYPTTYLANSPRQIRRLTKSFATAEFLSLHRVGQLDCVVPRPLRFASRLIDRVALATGLPGANLVVRLTK